MKSNIIKINFIANLINGFNEMTKIAVLSLILFLTACGGATDPQANNPFQQAIGRQLPVQGLAVEPKDPFAPMMEKKRN